MDLILVRHAKAVARAEWTGDDLERPLTRKGRREFLQFFRSVCERLPTPDCIVASKAVRAQKTAELCAAAFGKKRVLTDEALNPGCTPAKFRTVLRRHRHSGALLVVGHEPDLSGILEGMTGAESGTFRLPKGAVAQLESGKRNLRLRLLIAPEPHDRA